MKKLALITLAALLAPPALAEEVDRVMDADSDAHVHVSTISGSITVEGWDRDTLHITGTLGRNVKELQVSGDSDDIRIKVKVPNKGGRGTDANLRIRLPHGNSINVGTVSAEIEVEGVDGEQSLHTVSGSVDTVFSGEDVSAESVSGTVEVRGDGSDGEVSVGSVSGSVRVFGVSGEISAESVSGNVHVEGASVDDAELSTVNGRLKFRGELRDDADFDAETVNGSVDVSLGKNLSADIYIDTLNGRIRNCIGPDPKRTSKYGPGWELEFRAGNGDADIDISTVNGSISICND